MGLAILALSLDCFFRSCSPHKKVFLVVMRFDFIVGGDEVVSGKPAPDIYLKACSLLGADPANSIACEDSDFGIQAAFSAGLRAILVPDLLAPTEAMRRHAWKVPADLHEVAALVRQMRIKALPDGTPV